MSYLVLFSIFSLFISIHSCADPTKPTWPQEFAMPFGLYFTLVANSSATLYYNYDQAQAQLLVYDTHCFPLVRYNSIEYPCKMYFIPKGVSFFLFSTPLPSPTSKRNFCIHSCIEYSLLFVCG
jgi:hypothetical protein